MEEIKLEKGLRFRSFHSFSNRARLNPPSRTEFARLRAMSLPLARSVANVGRWRTWSTKLLERSRAQEANVGTQEAAVGAQEKVNFRDVVPLRTVIEAIKPFISVRAMKRLGMTAKDKEIWLQWKEARLLFLCWRLRVKSCLRLFPFAKFVLEAKGTLRRLSFHCSAC